jgi:hypothetical protein
MAELSHPFTCDVCGVHKGEQNHWFKVWENPAGLVCISVWDRNPAVEHFHCCGEEHALRKAGELLGKIGSAERGEPGIVK